MELETQPSSPYVTAPTSPNGYTTTTELYYSAPVSPQRKPVNPIATNGHHPSSNFDDFEFETSKNFSGSLHFDPSDHFDYDEGQNGKTTYPAMAFADDLFVNGLVMPLKLPPRLQYDSDCNSHKSAASSPRKVCKIPFARKSYWKDDFDPFMVALQKVSEEEKRGKSSRNRRSRSYSPFRAVSKCPSDCTNCYTRDFSKGDSTIEAMQVKVKAPSFSGPLDFKGSAYARWVRDQTREGLSPNSRRRSVFGQRASLLRNDEDGLDKPIQSKVQKLKGFLQRYASFGRGSQQTKVRSEKKKAKKDYSRLSFNKSSKENGQNKGKRNKKNAVVAEQKASVSLCLGY